MTTSEPSMPYCPSSLLIAQIPWVFTQRSPLTSNDFIGAAKVRGIDLDLDLLRDLYRFGLITPLYYVSSRAVSPPIEMGVDEPSTMSTFPSEFRHARERGRLQDLFETQYRPRLRFKRSGAGDPRWWNGLLFSHYQLLALGDLRALNRSVRHLRRGGGIVRALVSPHVMTRDLGTKFRGVALVLTALEARYLPNLDRGWIHLSNTDADQWYRYKAGFDPVALSVKIQYSAQQARSDAEFLLLRAHFIDPLDQKWQRLVRRTPRDVWKKFRNDALIAMDLREAAEILLRFYEDLAEHGAAEPLPDLSGINSWHPLNDRLSYHPETLDQDLMRLGLSPHPRVILAIEGDSEQVHVPRIWSALGYTHAPELIRVLKLGGVDRDLEKVAALAVAPLVGEKTPDGSNWYLIKPPARLLIAVDPEGRYFGTSDKVARTRENILQEVRSVLAAQNVTASEDDLAETIEINTWSASCYEFAHFNDEELAHAIRAIDLTCNGLTAVELVQEVAEVRSRRKDIKEVWSTWRHKPSKVRLAQALWPALETRIRRIRAGEDLEVPEIVAIVEKAYLTGQRWRRGSFVLRARQSQSDDQ